MIYRAKIIIEGPKDNLEVIKAVLEPDAYLPSPKLEDNLLIFEIESESPRKLRAEVNSLLRLFALIEGLLDTVRSP